MEKKSYVKKVKITSNKSEKSGGYIKRHFCPFNLMRTYIKHRNVLQNDAEQLFIYRDGSPVTAPMARKILKGI